MGEQAEVGQLRYGFMGPEGFELLGSVSESVSLTSDGMESPHDIHDWMLGDWSGSFEVTMSRNASYTEVSYRKLLRLLGFPFYRFDDIESYRRWNKGHSR